MNKFLKVMLIISGVIAIFGLVFVVIGFASGAKRGLSFGENGINIVSSDRKEISDYELDSFQKLSLKVSCADIEIVNADKFGIKILYHEGITAIPTYEVKDNTLTVTYLDNGKNNENSNIFSFLNFNFSDYDNRIIVYIPKDYNLDTVNIDDNLGDIEITDSKINSLVINSDLGDVELTNITANDMDVTLACGDVTLDRITSNTITVNDYLGDIDGSNIIGTNTNFYNSCGDITIDGNLTGNINLTDDLGSCELTLSGSQSDYNLNLKTSLGDVVVTNDKKGNNYLSQTNAANTVTISNSCGDIDVFFKK